MAVTFVPEVGNRSAEAERLLTAEQYFNEGDKEWTELINGKVVELMPPGGLHSELALKIGALLLEFVRKYGAGRAYGEAGFVLTRNPDTVRSPDAAYLEEARLPPEDVRSLFIEGAPTLAVEVMSPGDTWSEVQAKVQLYLENGTRLVWIIDPKTRTVTVRYPSSVSQVLKEEDILSGGDILPGFEVRVRELFE